MPEVDHHELQRQRGRELFRHMHRPREVQEAERRDRHRRWISALTARDWQRIGYLADQISDAFSPARLDDLDAPGIAVGVCQLGAERWCSGERVGTVRRGEVVVLVWSKT
jgi:hypothetical protein